jgi:hypothetical protein
MSVVDARNTYLTAGARRGTITSTSTTPGTTSGSFDHGVMATKGKRVMFVDYLTGTATAGSAVARHPQQQYAKL